MEERAVYGMENTISEHIIYITDALKERQINNQFKQACKQIAFLRKEKDELTAQGLHPGGYRMKEDKYMVKVMPTDPKTGKRESVYVGNDKDKMKEARAEGERYRRVCEINRELNAWARRLTAAKRQMVYAFDSLDGTKQARMW